MKERGEADGDRGWEKGAVMTGAVSVVGSDAGVVQGHRQHAARKG